VKPAIKFRASPHIVAHWKTGMLVLDQFATGSRVAADPAVVRVLHACQTWRTLDGISRSVPDLPVPLLRRVMHRLCVTGFVHRSDRRVAAREAAYDTWTDWNPAAGFFHAMTRDVRWAPPAHRQAVERALREKARTVLPPSAIKVIGRSARTELPRPKCDGEFASVLLARRTWRTFGRGPVALEDLSSLLALTAGVRMWGTTQAGERLAFKTSPSAGGRHPIELYVAARNVGGLRAGVYHYVADRHQLELVRRGITSRQIQRCLGHQWVFAKAAAVVFMTAVLARTQWRYAHPRSYRSVLAETGHVCQTFCLVATWLNLAPFCTMALADSVVEQLLKVDGVQETVLYAAGVGLRPAGGWTQWPDHEPGNPYMPLRRLVTRAGRT
jgi:SagB-type dehydrogenase family enzyme